MSFEVAFAAFIRMLILCLLTWAAYLVMFSIDMICTRVSCCDYCIAINWFIHVLMLFMSFVVAVPVSQLRASPRKGSKLLLWWMCDCDCPSKEGLVSNNLIADIMVVLQELYMSSMFVSSTSSIDSSWVGTEGCWSRKCCNCCVLASCLLKAFQWHSRCPSETCDVMIQEWHVGYVCRTGWKWLILPIPFPTSLWWGYTWTECCNVEVWWLLTVPGFFLWWIHKFYGRQICMVVNISPSSTELGVYIPEFYGQFQYDISYIAWLYFPSSLVFDIDEMSIALNADNSISKSPF